MVMGNNMFKFQIHSIQWKNSTQVTKYSKILSNDILKKDKLSIKHTGLIVTVNHEEEADLKKSTREQWICLCPDSGNTYLL